MCISSEVCFFYLFYIAFGFDLLINDYFGIQINRASDWWAGKRCDDNEQKERYEVVPPNAAVTYEVELVSFIKVGVWVYVLDYCKLEVGFSFV